MQTVSGNLLTQLRSGNAAAKSFAVLVEFYKSGALPSSTGFDPASADCLLSVCAVSNTTLNSGITYRGRGYKQLLTSVGDVHRLLAKQLSGLSLTLSNSTREVVDFERATNFEGLICVVRVIDRKVSSTLADSMVLFTGRCDRPDTFDRGSETVSIGVKQILSATEVNMLRRTYQPNDAEGRPASDPLFEGFRYTPRTGSVQFVETVRTKFLFFFHKTKKITRTLQYSSHSDLDASKFVPLALGRVQMQLLNFAYEDKGSYVDVLAFATEGEIAGFSNIRSVTPDFPISVLAQKTGQPGGTGNQTNDDPNFVGAGVYSRLAYIRARATGSQVSVDDAAPDIVAIVLGLKMPLPNAAYTAFSSFDFSDNPAVQARFVLSSPELFNLDAAWFDDLDTGETASYCDQILVDNSNTDTVQLQSSQSGIAGTAYRNYQSTGRISPGLWNAKSAGDYGGDYSSFLQPVDYQFYNGVPLNGDDFGGVVRLPPTAYRRRYTGNVLLSEQMKAIDFLYDILFPAFNGYLVQKASGKLAVRAKRPEDFAYMHAENAAGATEILVKNINPFATRPGRILIGANTPTSEVRGITTTRADTATSFSISAGGGVSASASTLTGGAPSTLTVSTASGAKSVTINNYLLNYTPSGTDSTVSVAATMAGQINSHNELNKYIKAEWTPGASTVTVSSRVGFLTLDAPLEYVHRISVANPAGAPGAAASAGGTLAAGVYRLAYSFETIEGETLTGSQSSVTVGANGSIAFAAIGRPARVQRVNWYSAVEAGGVRLRRIFTNDGSAWTLSASPRLDDDLEPIFNTTGEECHRVAMAFSDKGSSNNGLPNSNIIKATYKFPLGGRQPSTNRVDIKYRDASQDFQLTELRVRDKAHIAKVKKVNSLEINGAAIDNHHQASRIANQSLAETRDGDTFHAFTSDNEALLLEEGDVVCITDESGRYRNEPVRIEDVSIKNLVKYPQIEIIARKYRRYYYDDQIAEKLVPLPIVTNTDVNTEQGAPVIYQSGAATNTTVTVSVTNFSANAAFRKAQVATENTFAPANTVELVHSAQNEVGLILAPSIRIVRDTNLANAETKYIRIAHSSNGVTFGAWSNVLTVTYPNSGGTGGTAPQPAPTTGGGGGTTGGTGTYNDGTGGGGTACFSGDTAVNFTDEIEYEFEFIYRNREMFVGEAVKSFDDEGDAEYTTVEDVFEHTVFEYLEIKFSTDFEPMRATKEHPFLAENYEFKPAGDLRGGDKVWESDSGRDSLARIESVKQIKVPEGVKVYNMRTANGHYLANRKKVHNVKIAPYDSTL